MLQSSVKETWTYRSIRSNVFCKEGILQNSLETGVLKSHFNKVAGLQLYFKRRLQHRCFPVSIVYFLRTPILKSISERLLQMSLNKFRTLPLFFRSNRPEVFCEKSFYRNFAKFAENTCARVSFLIKLQARPATFLKNRLWRRCFPVNFGKFLRTRFFYRTPLVAAFV